jgi:subtilase family serine protease
VFAEATMKNITIFASSGDEGAAQTTCDGASWVKAASSPASDPLVTAVGDTELDAADYCLAALGCDPAINPAPGTHLGEIVWNEGPPYGDFQADFSATLSTGGGFSVLYGEPSYQEGTIHGGKQRGVPDVSYNAAVMHGVLTYLNIPGIPAGFYRFGGTSAGSPQWAAILAIADQRSRGGFNGSSQRLNGEELRWEDRNVAGHIVRHVLQCGRRVVPRRDVESTGVGSGKRSPAECPAKMPRWRPAYPSR